MNILGLKSLKLSSTRNLQSTKNQLDIVVGNSFVSDKSSLFVENFSDMPAADDEVARRMTSKAESIQQALLENGVVRTLSSELSDMDLIGTPGGVYLKWAGYPGNNPNKLTQACLSKLKELCDIGKVNKKQKVGAERAHQILLDTLIFDKWDQQLDLTVPKIKALFQMTPKKMGNAVNASEIPSEDVDEASRQLVDIELQFSALSMMDDDS